MIDCNDMEEELVYQEEKIGPYSFFLKVAEDDFNAEKKTLFATVVWFGARTLSRYLTVDKKEKIEGRSVIELGAGAGLCSIACRKIEASVVTVSDYPSPSVILNLRDNIRKNFGNDEGENSNFFVVEHIWGSDVTSLLSPLNGKQYDVVVASECLWKADTHENFAISINNVLKPGGTVYLSFSHHIPGNEAQDLNFFEIMKKFHIQVVDIKEVIAPHMW
eukprot:CAMPEP_0119045834 /NCGR_PEP_ID=MMETSP1177-20130426/42807_1 /TAXON_ID=2985 /ORGANISM="Ochromonas sp, Strain CCMP1899" /LENGTH=218 /DNA_ID=CAMNT_0007018217 /DNA_START=237 /DNA_END=890 /DNA_ORIENTATION=+